MFPTARGIAVVDPREVEPNKHPPSVRIEEVVVEGNRATSAGRHREAALGDAAASPVGTPDTKWVEMAPGERRVEVHYTALSFAAPEKVLFRYRLEPLEEKWVEAGTRRSANYSFCAPGQLHFPRYCLQQRWCLEREGPSWIWRYCRGRKCGGSEC